MIRSQALVHSVLCSNCLEMNFADCCTNELEFRICTNCKKYSLGLHSLQFTNVKMSTLTSNVCYAAYCKELQFTTTESIFYGVYCCIGLKALFMVL